MFATFYLAALSTGSWVYVFSALLDDRSLVFVAVILLIAIFQFVRTLHR